jgi:RHS repeat-associated protein
MLYMITPMKLSKINLLHWLLFGMLAFQSIFFARAGGIGVEQVQRDYQVRYYMATGQWLKWPSCTTGGTPAPQYPKDGFYHDVASNPVRGAEIVRDLVQKFYTDQVVYTGFVNATNFEDLENVSSIPFYTASDLITIDPGDVTTNNYMDKLQILASQITKLKMLWVQGEQVTSNVLDFRRDIFPLDGKTSLGEGWAVYTNDPGPAWDTVLEPCPSYSQVQSCSFATFPFVEWGNEGEGFVQGDEPCDEEPEFYIADYNYPISAFIQNWQYFDGGSQPGYLMEVHVQRGRIHVDLSRIPRGTNQIFFKLAAFDPDFLFEPDPGSGGIETSTFGQNRPITTDEGKYGHWDADKMIIGVNGTNSVYINSNWVPTAIIDTSLGDVETSGWQMVDQGAFVLPDFTVIPDPQDCCSCGCDGGVCMTTLQSIHINVGLGGENFGGSAGALTISAENPSPDLATLKALRYSLADNVNLITNADFALQHFQLQGSQILVDIQTNTAFKYTISFYIAADEGSTDGDGFYVPTGSAYTTVVVENPNTATDYNSLRVTTTTDGTPSVTDYIYTPANNQWEMDTGSGLRKQLRASAWNAGNDVRTETNTIKNASNAVAYKEINTYQQFNWGQEMVQKVVDPDGAALTSTWTFYTNETTDGGNYRQLKQEVDSNGHWVQYQYDSTGRETNRVSQFLNSTLGSGASANRVMATIYSTNDPQVTIVEKLLGQEVGRQYKIIHVGEDRDIQCQTPAASSTASDNLVTITKWYTEGSFSNQIQSVLSPDGTIRVYYYATNSTQKTTTELSGVPDSSGTNILNGTKTITVTSLAGKTISKTSYYVLAGSSDILTDQDVYTYLDSRNRSYEIVHLDGTSNQLFYACCGLNSEIGRDGLETQYLYDALKRQIASVQNGIMTSNVLDANGSVLAVIRVGTDDSAIPQSQAAFDLAGRMIRGTNALNGVTGYSNYFNGSGELVEQTTFPDEGTRIETYLQDGKLKSVTGSAVRPVRYDYGVEQEGSIYRPYTKEIKLDSGGSDTSEWTKSYEDMLGRIYKTIYASASGTPFSISYFDNFGHLTNTIDPDGISTLYTYNSKGEQEYTVLDYNQNGNVDFSGNDRIIYTTNDVVSDNGTYVFRRRTYSWTTSANSPKLISTAEISVDGLKSWNISWNNGIGITNAAQTVFDPLNIRRFVTNTLPDGSLSITTTQYGRTIAMISTNPSLGQLAAIAYGYDAHGRRITVTDARDGTVTNFYNNADQVASTATPSPSLGQNNQVTTNYFDTMGRIWKTTTPDGTSVTNEHNSFGDVTRTYGSRSYPAAFSYDAQGRMKTMTNWSSFADATGARVTAWSYDPYRGWLQGKFYDVSGGNLTGPSYTYTDAGRLHTRTWARGSSTTYGYNHAGDLETVLYSDGTSGITNVFDRIGRAVIVTNGATACIFAYDDSGRLLGETYSGGPLNGMTVTNVIDSLSRRKTNGLWNGTAWLSQTHYGYDSASRISTVDDGADSVTYNYLPNSPLVSQMLFTNAGTLRLTTTKSFDYLNRLSQISAAGANDSISSTYVNNTANQRTGITNSDNSYWIYQRDALGQVTSGKKYWSDGVLVAGQQFTYAFDDIGNRQSAAFGGDASGGNLHSANYTNNSLNQIVGRDVPGYINVLGEATNTAVVNVNSQATYRKTNYFQRELTVDNSSSALWLGVTNVAIITNSASANIAATNLGNIFISKNAEVFAYDVDGNLTNDGRWTYAWDSENRLTNMTSLSTAPSGSKLKLDFAYDYRGRRVQKVVSTNNGASYIAAYTNKYAYDGWNMIAEFGAGDALVRSYMWGTDLSGSMQGAGGVGGLLCVSYHGSSTTNCLVISDGNGNVAGLVDASNGNMVGRYEYGPYGELLRRTDTLSVGNPFCFSTKFQDQETDLLYYGYRFYSANQGRWLSRDSLGERGGADLYHFLGNAGIESIDYLGLEELYTQGLGAWDTFWLGFGNDFISTGDNVWDATGRTYYDLNGMAAASFYGTEADFNPCSRTMASALSQNPDELRKRILKGIPRAELAAVTFNFSEGAIGTYNGLNSGDWTHAQNAFGGIVFTAPLGPVLGGGKQYGPFAPRPGAPIYEPNGQQVFDFLPNIPRNLPDSMMPAGARPVASLLPGRQLNFSDILADCHCLDWDAVLAKRITRPDHVRLHNVDNPLRTTPHGVFLGDGVKLMDEAFGIASKLGLVPDADSGINVPMGRIVGFSGGANGTGELYSSIRIVVVPGSRNQVITGYPVK